MGHTTHRAVLAFTWDEKVVPCVKDFRVDLPDRLQSLFIGPVEGIVNSHFQWVFLSSGSKDGWGDHDLVDEWQDKFANLFEQFKYDDGSTPVTVITVQVGEGEGEPILYDSPKTYYAEGGVPYVTQYDKD